MKIKNIVTASILIREYEDLEKFIGMLKDSKPDDLWVYNRRNTHGYLIDVELYETVIKHYEDKLLGIKNVIEEL
jgi:hypothetical protein